MSVLSLLLFRGQVRVVRGVPCFALVKNRKEHRVPLAESLRLVLAERIRHPAGDPVAFRLIVTRPVGRPPRL